MTNNLIWSILDDDIILLKKIIKDNSAKTVLEFGPGTSTTLFLSQGLLVHSCENNRIWEAKCKGLLTGNVSLFHYEDLPEIKIEGLLDRYDLGFVDSPVGTKTYS